MDLVTYALCKKQIAAALAGAGALSGKSAYDIAVENGFSGSQEEWLDSLKGKDGYTPYIGDNGNWFINGEDTNISATSNIKITSAENVNELVINEKEQEIFSIINGEKVIVANYDKTTPIEDDQIVGLFIK